MVVTFGLVGLFLVIFRGKKKPQVAGAPVPQSDSTREVIETVVFVVVLVLLLKSFTAEAFVIPTGSMAETLWGYQKLVKCPQCELEFPVNCANEVDPSDGSPPTWMGGCTCPNCRQHIEFVKSGDAMPHQAPADQIEKTRNIPDPGWKSGDRVLVAKFVYDLLNTMPDRLDVVVFKWPGDRDFPNHAANKRHVSMNYIKRLVGLPGETIALYKGKLYFLSPQRGLKFSDVEEANGDKDKLALLWKHQNMHAEDGDEARKRFNAGEFEIVRKNPGQILAMRRIVYDTDHPAKDLQGPKWNRWLTAKDSAWQDDGKRGFRADGDDQMQWLRYRHVLRDRPNKPQLITDFMGYNTWEGGNPRHVPPGENWASDLMIECDATIEKPEGELTLEVSKGVDRFQARFNLATGTCELFRLTDGKKEELLGTADARVNRKGTYRLRLANVDQKLTVWVDNRLPFEGDGVTYAFDERKLKPNPDNDLERPASIGVRGAKVAVQHLKVYRDTYYTAAKSNSPSSADVSFEPDNPATWEKLEDAPLATLYVQPNHFLCLGDNSPESSDGRTWGLVPRRLMLGKAVLIYYPFGRAGRIR
jgi:signal peptidase I